MMCMLHVLAAALHAWKALVRGFPPWTQGLPAWNILLLGRKPFAVSVHDCSAVPAVVSAANAKVLSLSLPCGCAGRLHDAS